MIFYLIYLVASKTCSLIYYLKSVHKLSVVVAWVSVRAEENLVLVCRCIKSVISCGRCCLLLCSVDSHLLDRRRLMSATVVLHAELLHEQAVLYAGFLYSLITHDNFLSLNFKFLFAVKIAWGEG